MCPRRRLFGTSSYLSQRTDSQQRSLTLLGIETCTSLLAAEEQRHNHRRLGNFCAAKQRTCASRHARRQLARRRHARRWCLRSTAVSSTVVLQRSTAVRSTAQHARRRHARRRSAQRRRTLDGDARSTAACSSLDSGTAADGWSSSAASPSCFNHRRYSTPP